MNNIINYYIVTKETFNAAIKNNKLKNYCYYWVIENARDSVGTLYKGEHPGNGLITNKNFGIESVIAKTAVLYATPTKNDTDSVSPSVVTEGSHNPKSGSLSSGAVFGKGNSIKTDNGFATGTRLYANGVANATFGEGNFNKSKHTLVSGLNIYLNTDSNNGAAVVSGVSHTIQNKLYAAQVSGKQHVLQYIETSLISGELNSIQYVKKSLVAGSGITVTGLSSKYIENSVFLGNNIKVNSGATKNIGLGDSLTFNPNVENVYILGNNLTANSSNTILIGRYNVSGDDTNYSIIFANGEDEKQHNVFMLPRRASGENKANAKLNANFDIDGTLVVNKNIQPKGMVEYNEYAIDLNKDKEENYLRTDSDTYYPVLIPIPKNYRQSFHIVIKKNLTQGVLGSPYYSNVQGKPTSKDVIMTKVDPHDRDHYNIASNDGAISYFSNSLRLEYEVDTLYWQGGGTYVHSKHIENPYANVCCLAGYNLSEYGCLVVWLRGGSTGAKVTKISDTQYDITRSTTADKVPCIYTIHTDYNILDCASFQFKKKNGADWSGETYYINKPIVYTQLTDDEKEYLTYDNGGQDIIRKVSIESGSNRQSIRPVIYDRTKKEYYWAEDTSKTNPITLINKGRIEWNDHIKPSTIECVGESIFKRASYFKDTVDAKSLTVAENITARGEILTTGITCKNPLDSRISTSINGGNVATQNLTATGEINLSASTAADLLANNRNLIVQTVSSAGKIECSSLVISSLGDVSPIETGGDLSVIGANSSGSIGKIANLKWRSNKFCIDGDLQFKYKSSDYTLTSLMQRMDSLGFKSGYMTLNERAVGYVAQIGHIVYGKVCFEGMEGLSGNELKITWNSDPIPGPSQSITVACAVLNVSGTKDGIRKFTLSNSDGKLKITWASGSIKDQGMGISGTASGFFWYELDGAPVYVKYGGIIDNDPYLQTYSVLPLNNIYDSSGESMKKQNTSFSTMSGHTSYLRCFRGTTSINGNCYAYYTSATPSKNVPN